MTALLFEAALRSLILGIAVGLGLRLFRVRNTQVQMTAWIVVLAAALAMPVLMQWPMLRLPTGAAVLPRMLTALDPAGPAHAPLPSMPGSPGSGFRWGAGVLACVYVAVAGALLLRLLLGLAATWRIARVATPVRAWWARGADVRITPAISAPVTFGRIILLPVAFAEWSPAKRRAVMCHERSHIEHHDFTVQILSNLHSALFWFSPLAWWLQLRLAFLAELTSDEAAVAQLGDRIDYAEILLDIAVGARGLPASIAMARPAMLRQRVEHVLSGAALGIALAPRYRLLLALSLVPVVLIAGGTVLHARAGDLPNALAGRAASETATRMINRGEAATADTPSFAILSGGRVTANGDDLRLLQVLSARSGNGVDTVLFLRDGAVYEVTDPALVKQATDLFGPAEELDQQQQALGEQQRELGREQTELGQQLGETGRQIGALARQHATQGARHAAAATREATLADAEGGDAVRDPADADRDFEQGAAELRRQMSALGQQQGVLGRQQGALRSEQGRLSHEQSESRHETNARMQALLDRAFSSGAATPVP